MALNSNTPIPAYRFRTFVSGGGSGGGLGPYIYPTATAIRSSGLRATLTPDGDCRELTLQARNGPLKVGTTTYPGFGLTPLKAVQLQVQTGSDPTQDSAWTPLWFGEVRVGGNKYDFTGENQTWRGMSQRLKEIVAPAQAYASGDVGDVVWAVMQATNNAGISIASDNIILDRTLVPVLGITATAPTAQPFVLATFFDQIVSDGLSKAGKVFVYGVRPDRKFFFHEARTDTLTLIADELHTTDMKAPVAETPCNIVLWYAGHDSTGTALTHQTFNGPSVARWGGRAIIKTLPSGVSATVPVGGTAMYSGTATSQTSTQSRDPNLVYGGVTDSPLNQARMQDASEFTSVKVVNTNAVPSITYTLTGDAYQVAVAGLCNGPTGMFPIKLDIKSSSGQALHSETYGSATLNFSGGWVGSIPKGSTVKLSASAASGDSSVYLAAFNFTAQGLNTDLMDSQANSFFSDPAEAPAEIETRGWVTPDALAGNAALPLQDGTLYSEPVATYEYRLNAAGGLNLGILPGQPTDPAILARNALIKRLASDAAAQAASGGSG